ncbi:MAG: RagB/SusD family nutrient uptake outer membrane protein [Ferruginibacter sp.]|nr:RagB/SusD family nutrient uptake outer membrane protein [Cytophagales bacterium]
MNKLTACILSIALLSLPGCSSLLEVEPRQSIDTDQALATPEGIRAALFGTYSNLKAQALYGRDLLAIAEALGDNTVIINRAGGRFVNEGQNVINNHLGGWGTYYYTINQCNLILKALPESTLPEPEKDTIEGEVKFIRALMYFDLSRVYAYEPGVSVPALDKGAVPLLLEGIDSPEQVAYPVRNAAGEVYAQIYRDLQDATAKAPATGGPNRATAGAAHALLARVALYNQDWSTAVQSATAALASSVGRLAGNSEYVAAWRANGNPESIFEVLFNSRQESLGVNNSLQSAYTTIGSVSQASSLLASRPTPLPPATGWGSVVPTPTFLGLFTTGDVRRQLYQLGLNRSNNVIIECTKFLGKSGTIYMDNVPVLRVSEMYLIRAEAAARLNQLVGAAEDVNRIRTRAGLLALTELDSQTKVLTEIELQRRLELAFEGHRWFDLKRQGRDVVKATGNVSYGDTRTLAPLPNSEILANKNLEQNSGY